MAKQGLSYYQAETDRFQDIKVKRLKKKYGCEGYAIYNYVENEIHRTNGAFLRITDDIIFDIAEYWGIEEDQVERIINFMTEIDIFEAITYKTRHVLTSARIQQRYVSICKHAHKQIFLPAEIQLIDIATEQVTQPVSLPLFANAAPETVTGTPCYAQPELIQLQPQPSQQPAKPLQESPKPSQTAPEPSQTTSGQPAFAEFRETSRNPRTKSNKTNQTKTNPSSVPQKLRENQKEEAEKLISALIEKEQKERIHASTAPEPPKRNTQGLLYNIEQLNIPPKEAEEICVLSNYGEIGHPVWQLFDEIRKARGKITMPGRFILSRLKQDGTQSGNQKKAS